MEPKKMESASPTRERWLLTKDALDRFLSALDSDPAGAGVIYEQIRSKLTTFFRCNGCWEDDALVDETLDRVMRRLGEVEVHNLTSFIRGVARHVASEAHKRNKKTSSIEEIPEPVWDRSDRSETQAPEQESALYPECLKSCIHMLSPEDNKLISEYYCYEKRQKIEQKQALTATFGITASALRVRAFRARKRLQKCVLDCVRRSLPYETKRESDH